MNDKLRRQLLGVKSFSDADGASTAALQARLAASERLGAAAAAALTKMANGYKDCGGCAFIGDSIDKCEYQHTGDCYVFGGPQVGGGASV